MAIGIRTLRAAGSRPGQVTIAKSLNEARQRRQQTAFLCHSHRDDVLAQGLQNLLTENGWNVYIDWQDTDMPETPTKETAAAIKKKIAERDWFLFLATPESVRSRWCPWEIGYADSVKSDGDILIIQTEDDSGNFYGNEYLQLYRKITNASDRQSGRSGYAMFEAGDTSNGRWLRNL